MKNKIMNVLIIVIGIFILIQFVYTPIRLVIGFGDSMKPTFEGTTPMICYKTKNYDIDDIVYYEINNIPVVHRIISIYDDGVVKLYQTKGDGNESADNYMIYKENIKCKIKS